MSRSRTGRSFGEVLPILALLALGIYALATAFKSAMDVPQVYVSRSTGACMDVVTGEGDRGKYSCKALPKKYERVWVSEHYSPLPRD